MSKLSFSKDIAKSYLEKIEIYDKKIKDSSITSQERKEAQILIGDYYQYLAATGIKYGSAAYDVSQNQGSFGQFANKHLRVAAQFEGRFYENLNSDFMIKLALGDANARIDKNADDLGSISYEQIADLHYSILEGEDFKLKKTAWGGHFLEEFAGSGSWMDLGGYDNSIDVKQLSSILSLALNSKSDDISARESFEALLQTGEGDSLFAFDVGKSSIAKNLINALSSLGDDLYEINRDNNAIISKFSDKIQEVYQGFADALFEDDGSVKEGQEEFYNKIIEEGYYQIKPQDTLSQIANSLGLKLQDLIDSNPWLQEKGRIQQGGKYILIKPEEKLSINLSKINASIKITNATLKDKDGNNYNKEILKDIFINQNQSLISLNLDQEEKSWQNQSLQDLKLDQIKLEFDFETQFKKAFGLDQGYNPINPQDINNHLLNLSINTDLNSNFRPTSNPDQVGNAIDGGDYYIESDISVLNGDGVANTTPMGILTDQYRPGNTELSTQQDFINNLTLTLDDLELFQNSDKDNHPIDDNFGGPASPNYSLGLNSQLADIFNQSKASQNFLNIDPVILDLNNDNKINLISYQNSEVIFDVDNDNKQERTGWVSGQEGILVHDLNNDGKINDITETISEYYNPSNNWIKDEDGKYSKHGLAALKKLDSNNDDKFDNQDTLFKDLKIWQDQNENGITDQGELKTLTEAGIKEFDLSKILEIDKQRNEGNVILAQTTFTTIYGQKQLTQAVDFTTNPIGYEFNDVNLGKLATAEDGSKSLAITGKEGKIVDASQESVLNIFGGAGDDTITGDDQDNMLSGGAGSDTLKGGKGHDILIIDEYDKQENIDGGQGRDIVIINSDNGVSLNLTKANIETAVGGNGDDVLIGGGTSNVFIDGGNGDDVIIGGAADDALSGSDGNDYIDGAFGDDVIRGHRGNDVLIGGKGDDLIDGGLGNDKLFGGKGKEILIGGQGNDEIDGGEGHDLAKYAGDYANYQIYKEGDAIKVKNKKTGDIDTLKNIEGIRFDNVTIKIEENTAPLAVADKITVDAKKNEYFITKSDLLKNDIDLERHKLDIKSVENAVGGKVEIIKDQDGQITGVKFTPNGSRNGIMSFDYSTIDEKGAYATVTKYNNDGSSVQAIHKARVQFKLSDDPSDPLYYDQWYLSEINVKDAWKDYSGKGVTIGIFEDGDFNRNHQDLDNNILENHKKDQEFRQIDNFSQHATTVAGVIAAENNDYGIIGVAHGAKLDGYGWSPDESGLVNLKNVDIANNSWGKLTKFADNFADFLNPNAIYAKLLQDSVQQGRDGLGTINIFAGGNQRQEGDNVNYHNLQNSRFVITTGSINQEGDLGALIEASTPFSNPGAAILVSAPGSNIKSTGNVLENNNGSQFLGEFSSAQGTSFSAPIISGIVALMLEANPNLGYRDVQKILALSARKFDDPNTVWQENGADNFNGSGMHYSHDYGFGIVDAKAAVRLAEIWGETNGYFNEKSLTAQEFVNGGIKDSDTSYVSFDIKDSNLYNIENVEVFVDIVHKDISELRLILTSPSGTKSVLMDHPKGDLAYKNGLKFTFSSRHFLGEKVDGQWKLEIIDNKEGNIGTIKSWELKFYGKLDDGKDDVYFYTNEIKDAKSFIIKDNDGGIDTINAVTVDGDNIINLNAGEMSTLNGQSLSIASNKNDEEYSAQQQRLVQKQDEIISSSTIIAQKKALVKEKEVEYDEILIKIAEKAKEYNEIKPKYDNSIKEFQDEKSWFDNHEYNSGIDFGGGNIVLIFKRKSDGATIQMQKREYDARVADYNSKLNRAQDLENKLNEVVANYNDLTTRKNQIPSEIKILQGEAEDQYQKLKQLEKEIAFIEDYLDSFSDENNTVIENAYSGDGNDKLIGNEQDNKLMAGRGENELTGGAGKDIFVIKRGSIKDIITDFNLDRDKIDLSEFGTEFAALEITQDGDNAIINIAEQEIILQNIETKEITAKSFRFDQSESGTQGDDVINGTNLNDEIDGKGGNDVISGLKGEDTIYGGAGDDRIFGGKGNDIIFDGAGKDVIYGDDGDDIIHIQDGNLPSVFINGAFSEIDSGFFGGKGDDTFVITDLISGGGFLNNLIYDFEVENSNEKIDLTAFSNIKSIDDLNFGDISINGQKYLRVTIFNQDDFAQSKNFTLKNIAKEQLSNDNFIFVKQPELVAKDDEFKSKEDEEIKINFSDLLKNDSELAEVGEIITDVRNGTLALKDGKYFLYTPDKDFSGIDGFQYQAVFPNGEKAIASVKINIEQVNDAPVLKNYSVSTSENTAIYIDVLKDAIDIEGDELSIVSVEDGANGVATIHRDEEGGLMRIKYTPNDDFSGQDRVVYRVSDGQDVVEKELAITVDFVNDAPKITIPDQIIQQSPSFDVDLSKYIIDDSEPQDLSLIVKQKNGSILPSYLKFDSGGRKLSFTPLPGVNIVNLALIFEVFDGKNRVEKDFQLLFDRNLENQIIMFDDHAQTVSTVFRDVIFGNAKNNSFHLMSDGKIAVGFSVKTSTPLGDIDISNMNFFKDAIDGDAGYDRINLTDESDAFFFDSDRDLLMRNIEMINAKGGDDVIIIDDGVYDDKIDIVAGDGNDTVITGSGNDRVWSGNGDDKIATGDGKDYVRGGNGDDEIYGDTGNDFLYGDSGQDLVLGGNGDDYIYGGEGEDILNGDDGNDAIKGDAGNDKIQGGQGDDKIWGNAGNDIIYGNAGNDMLSPGDGKNTTYGGQGKDRIYTGSGDNIIYGDEDNDYIRTKGGNDQIYGGEGADAIYGDDGNDKIQGGQGNDYIRAGNDDDTINGDSGNDIIYGDDGHDTIDGGQGDDKIWGNAGNDIIDGGAGNDMLSPGSGDDIAKGGTGKDRIYAGEGDDDIHGGAGEDYVRAGGGSDTIHGNEDNDYLLGEDGNDAIHGNQGDDQIRGGNGQDVIFGDGGNDILKGDAQNDEIHGGIGNDKIWGGIGDDIINGDDGDDMLSLGDGDDIAQGGFGNDRIYAGTGNDTIYGNAGDDYIRGYQDNDTIRGNDGNDDLYGDDGDDKITGGQGRDRLIGGEGQDIFIYESLNESTKQNIDTIIDFTKGQDKIDLSLFEFDQVIYDNGNDNQDFANKNTLKYRHEGSYTVIEDENSDFATKIYGKVELEAGDFMF